jgi:hypothetical protein
VDQRDDHCSYPVLFDESARDEPTPGRQYPARATAALDEIGVRAWIGREIARFRGDIEKQTARAAAVIGNAIETPVAIETSGVKWNRNGGR